MRSSDAPRWVALAGAAARRTAPARARWRRAVLVRRLLVAAAAAGVKVEVDVALDAVVGRRVVVDVSGPGRVVVGAGARLGDGVRLQLKGDGAAEVVLHAWSDVRAGCVLNVSGAFALGSGSVLGAGSTVHCARSVTVGAGCGIGEGSTLVDSSHHHTEPGAPVMAGVRVGAVVVGDGAFVGAGAVLTRTAVVGDLAFVGAGSVVVGEVPRAMLASGVPATVQGPVAVPWEGP